MITQSKVDEAIKIVEKSRKNYTPLYQMLSDAAFRDASEIVLEIHGKSPDLEFLEYKKEVLEIAASKCAMLFSDKAENYDSLLTYLKDAMVGDYIKSILIEVKV